MGGGRETAIVRVTATHMFADARGDVSGGVGAHTWYYHPECWEAERARGTARPLRPGTRGRARWT